MCLVVDKKLHPTGESLTASENIVVGKILAISYTGRYLTPYRFKEVRFHNDECKLKKVSLGVKTEYFMETFASSPKLVFEVEEGYHAYTSLPIARNFVRHSANGNTWKIFEAYIPKGAEYYVGVAGDIVSSEMVITNKIIN